MDPYLDPQRRGGGYANFHRLLEHARAGTRVEIHRGAEVEGEDGVGFRQLSRAEWEERFAEVLRVVRKCRLRCHFFLWRKSRHRRFHDRYLFTNLLSVGLQNGFDEDEQGSETSWHRLGAKDSEDIQRQYERNYDEASLACEWEAT